MTETAVMETEQVPLKDMKIAITMDDLLMWTGLPMPDDYDPVTTTTELVATLRKHGITGLYGFSHTQPLDDHPEWIEIFDVWESGGHHVGNHTHEHAPVSWLPADAYIDDIKKCEDDFIGDYVQRAPDRYFRYAMDMPGESEERFGCVEDWLKTNKYRNAPVTAGFGDALFIVPHYRAWKNGDAETVSWLQDKYVEAAVQQLGVAGASAKKIFGRSDPLIWLIHGSPITNASLDATLTAFEQAGVQFVTLNEAMAAPIHRLTPPVRANLYNHLQRHALTNELPVPDLTPEFLGEVANISPLEGWDSAKVWEEKVLIPMSKRCGDECQYAYPWQ